MEIWKTIPGYEGFYEASNYGNIKSMTRYRKNGNIGYVQKERIMKPRGNVHGYLVVCLSKYGVVKLHSVHRLIALSFLENPKNKPNINHKDNNPLNNSVGNIEWVTQKENIQHMIKQGRKACQRGNLHPKRILSEDDAVFIRNMRKKLNCNAKAILNESRFVNRNISISCINGVIYNQTWRHLA